MTLARRATAVAMLVLAALFGIALLKAPRAEAHATVVGSSPIDGSRLQQAPSAVTIEFDEPVSLGGVGYLHVVNQTGQRVDTGSASHPNGDGTKITTNLRSGLGDGTYFASFRIISADSHPVAGSIRFVVGNGALAPAIGGTSSTVNLGTNLAFQIARWLTFAGLAGLGGSWLLFTVWPQGRDDRWAYRLVWAGWGVTVVAGLAELLLQGPYTAGLGLGHLFDGSLIDATLHTSYGTLHSIRLVLLGALGAVLAVLFNRFERTGDHLEDAAGILGVGVIVTYAASGHFGATSPRWLTLTSDSLHLTAMSIWLGGLLMLTIGLLPRSEPDELRTTLPVFSLVAYCCVATLAVTGVYQGWREIGSWDALVSTRYGQLVFAKVVLFIGLLALGNLSRMVVQRRYVRRVAFALSDHARPASADGARPPGPDGATDLVRLRRSVIVEVAVAAIVLAVTAVLVAEPPGRAAATAAAAKPQTATMELTTQRSATVTVDPGKHGTVDVTVDLSEGPSPQQITATASLPAKQLGPINIPLTPTGKNSYTANGVLLPAAGKWLIELNVRTSEFDAVVSDATIRLH